MAHAPGLYGTFDFRTLSGHNVKQEISATTSIPQLKSNTSLSREKADAKRIAEETKDSAAASKRYDTVIPPLCLLMLGWLSLALSGSEKEKS